MRATIRLDPWGAVDARGVSAAPRGPRAQRPKSGGASGRAAPSAGVYRLSQAERADRQTANVVDVLRNAMSSKRKLFGRTLSDLGDIFKAADHDGGGSIDYAEFTAALRRLGLGLCDEQSVSPPAALSPQRAQVAHPRSLSASRPLSLLPSPWHQLVCARLRMMPRCGHLCRTGWLRSPRLSTPTETD